HSEESPRREAAPISQKDGDVGGEKTRDCQIGMSVGIEIANGDTGRLVTRGKQRWGAEGSIAVSREQRDVVAVVVGRHQIPLPVTVEIARHQGNLGSTGEGERRWSEGPVAVAQ